MNYFDVAIIGLGPAGSMAALLLESYGMKVLCIDREKEIYNLPRAVTVSDQGFRMCQLAGIDDIYLKNSTILGGAYFSDKNLEIIGGSIDLKGFVSANVWPASSLFHQPFTDRDIRNKLENSNVEIILEHEFISLNQNQDSVSFKTINLRNQEIKEFTSRYLIGSDGGSSVVRKQLDIPQEDLNYNRDWVVIDVELNNPDKLGDKLIQVCDKERLATFVPSHLPFRRWEFIIHEHEDKESFLKDTIIHELISKWLKPEEYRIIRKAVYQFHSVIAKNFQKGNCFLVGDAAHQAPPFMGEGMMSGYRDAVNLSWKIATSIKNKLNANLIDTYEIERIPHSRFVVKNSAGIGELMEAYAEAETPEQVSQDLVQKGYGSFILPNLTKGLFFGGKADESMNAGEIFPQPVEFENKEIVRRMDHILGKGFSLISNYPLEISEDNHEFLDLLGCKLVTLEKKYIAENPWMKPLLEKDRTYLVRPDRYIFGSTNSNISIDMLINDLKMRIMN